MMVRAEVIRKRLNKLDEYLEILDDLKKYSLEEFLSKPEYYGSVERFLQLAIETTVDIGNHIVADLGLGEVNWYSDIAAILEEKTSYQLICAKNGFAWLGSETFSSMITLK